MGAPENTQAILIAVTDPLLHPEAIHVAAATGRSYVDTVDPREFGRHLTKASAVLVDAKTSHMVNHSLRRERVFFLCPDSTPVDWRLALQAHAEQAFSLPAQAADLLTVLGREDRRTNDSQPKSRVIGLMGAVGGVGTSVFSAVLARRLAQCGPWSQHNTALVLIDADRLSGGLNLLFGMEDSKGVRWPDLSFRKGKVDACDVLAALPTNRENVRVLSTGRSKEDEFFTLRADDVYEAIKCLSQSGVDLIVDLHADEIAEKTVELLDYLFIIVPGEIRGVAAAAHLLSHYRQYQVPTSLVLRHRGWSGLEREEIEEILDQPVIAEFGTFSKLSKTIETRGLTDAMPKPAAVAADAVYAETE